MTNGIDRRRALKLIIRLPVTAFGLSRGVTAVAAEEVMPWVAAGIGACWELGRGSDLTLASSTVSLYIPTLARLSDQPRYRKAAANLAAQAWLLKSTLGWHTETLDNALQHAIQAEKYAKIAEDGVLQVGAIERTGLIHYYARRPDLALLKLEEAREIIEHNKVPATVARLIYLNLAAYEASTGNSSKTSMKKAHRLFGVGASNDPVCTWLGYESLGFLRWEGFALSCAGDHEAALSSYDQVAEPTAGIAERTRVELLCNQLASKLRMKDRDIEECTAIWIEAMAGAKTLQSEQRYNEAVALYEMMQCAWPGEARIEELRSHIAHW